MAQASSITVNDRETTPVAHTFAPRQIVPGAATFVESASVPVGEKTLTVRTRRSGSRFYHRITLVAPVLVSETVNGVSVPKVPRMAYIDCNIRFEDTSTLQERKNAIGMFAAALAPTQTVIDGTLTGLEGIW